MARHGVTDEQHECDQSDKISGIEREVGRLNTAVFLGNGTPSIVAQLAVIRQAVNALCWLVGGVCMAVIGQIVILLFRAMGKI